MAAEFLTPKSGTPNPSAWSGCASARRCWAARCVCRANRARAPPCGYASRGRAKLRPTRSLTVMNILIADDHAVVRQGLKLILADHFKRAAFGEARNAHEAL